MRAEAAAEGDALRVGGRRRVERPGRRRLPVDDEDLVPVVVHPAAPDVERSRRPVDVEAAEDEAAVGVLEGAQPAARPRLERERGDLAVGEPAALRRSSPASARAARRRRRRRPVRRRAPDEAWRRRDYRERAAQLVLDGGRVEAARGEQDVAVEPEVGELRDEALVALGQRRRERPRPPPRRPSARTPRAAVEQPRDVRALRPLARALGDRPPEPRREARHGAGVARGPGRPHAQEERVAVAVVAQLLDRERVAGRLALAPELLARAAPEPAPRPSRACAAAPRRPSTRASARGRCPASWTIAARRLRRHRGAAPRARAARRAATRAGPGPRGGSRRAAPPARPRAPRRRARPSPAPPEAITGIDTASGDRAA